MHHYALMAGPRKGFGGIAAPRRPPRCGRATPSSIAPPHCLPQGGCDEGSDARAERRGEHVPVEGAEGANSARGAANPLLPPRTPDRGGVKASLRAVGTALSRLCLAYD